MIIIIITIVIVVIITVVILFEKCHMVITSAALVAVKLVVKGQVK